MNEATSSLTRADCDNHRQRQARRVDPVSAQVLAEPLWKRPAPQAHVVSHPCRIVIEMQAQKFPASRQTQACQVARRPAFWPCACLCKESAKTVGLCVYIPIFSEGDVMSWWNIFGHTAVSDSGKVIQRVSDTSSVSSDGTTYTRMGSTTVGSDGSIFTQTGSFSSDGSTRMGGGATGIGAVFNKRGDGFHNDDW